MNSRILNTDSSDGTPLSPELKAALDDALDACKEGHTFTHEEVMQITKEKYSALFREM